MAGMQAHREDCWRTLSLISREDTVDKVYITWLEPTRFERRVPNPHDTLSPG